MTPEETVVQELVGKFPFFADKIRVQRARRLWADVPADQFEAVAHHIFEKMGFIMLCALTGLDEGATFGLLYHFGRPSGMTLNLKVSIPREKPEWKSMIGMFPGNELYEREVADLYGIRFEGLPPGLRYPLPDDWPDNEFPLRKDWKAKHTVTPVAPAVEVKS